MDCELNANIQYERAEMRKGRTSERVWILLVWLVTSLCLLKPAHFVWTDISDDELKARLGDAMTFMSSVKINAHDHNITTKAVSCKDCIRTSAGEARSVLYVKTHKTGSSTVTGLLWRELCLRLRFNCFLPPVNRAGRFWDISNNKDKNYMFSSIGTDRATAPFQAWLHHIKYATLVQTSHHTSLVKAPFLLVSSVRKPALRFESAWYWYDHTQQTNMTLQTFIQHYIKKHSLRSSVQFKYHTGLEATSQELAATRKRLGHELLPAVLQYRLFLIVCDRFDESILVLKWLLRFQAVAHSNTSWMYLRQKVRPNEAPLSDAELQALDRLQPHDLLLYRAANLALDRYIAFYGPRFPSDLRRYTHRLEHIQQRCPELSSPASRTATRLHHTEDDKLTCSRLQRDNREAIQRFRAKLAL